MKTKVEIQYYPHLSSATDILRDKKKRTDVYYIHNHIIKTQASDSDRVLIESAITNLMKENLIFNKKTTSGLIPSFETMHPLNKETCLVSLWIAKIAKPR